MIIKRIHNSNYTVVTNDIFENETLNAESIGTLTYLLSKPDHWTVSTKHLCNRFNVGRDKMQRILKGLIESGYVVYRPVRVPNGTVKGSEYVIYDNPQSSKIAAKSRKPEKPVSGDRKPEKPETGKHGPIVSTDLLVNTESNIVVGEKGNDEQTETSNPSPQKEINQAFELYNETAKRSGLQALKKITAPRRKHMAARLKDCEGLDGWRDVLAIVEASAFLTGKAKSDRPFKTTIDFLLRESSFVKVIEHAYLTDIEKAKLVKRKENSKPETFTDQKWRAGILPVVLEHNTWQPAWGPAPGQPDCFAPADIIPVLQEALAARKVAA